MPGLDMDEGAVDENTRSATNGGAVGESDDEGGDQDWETASEGDAAEVINDDDDDDDDDDDGDGESDCM